MSEGIPAFRLGEPGPLALSLAATALASAAAQDGGPASVAAVARQLGETLRGIEAWQRHPYRRRVEPPPALWQAGSSRLLDYRLVPEARPGGAPVLVVPSLINRAYVLDLMAERSMLRWMAAQGLRPLLLDWGAPGPAEAAFDLGDYGALRLMPALAAARAAGGGRVAVMGYCMGGTLAAGLAARAPEGLSALVTLGAPWDFDRATGPAGALRALAVARGAAEAEAMIAVLGAVFGGVPVAVLQGLFALVDPLQAATKFPKLARMDAGSGAARCFVALEDWLADGVPMAPRAARDLLVDWQIRNAPGRGAWRFLGGLIRPGDIAVPTLAFCGTTDRIAPTPVSEPLAEGIEGARTERPATGHVGMVVGSAARARVWEPIAAFLRTHAG